MRNTTPPPAVPMPPAPTPRPHRAWTARLVALMFAAVSIPYCTIAFLLMRDILPQFGLYVMAVLTVAAFLPAVLRAYGLASGAVRVAPATLAARFEAWLGALAVTFVILLASHIAFFCVCFPAGLTTFQLYGRMPNSSLPVWEQLYAAWPWVVGVMAASAVAYWLTGRLLGALAHNQLGTPPRHP